MSAVVDTATEVRPFGERGFVVTVADAAQARAIATMLRDVLGASAISVVPGMESVVIQVFRDADVLAFHAAIEAALNSPTPALPEPRTVTLPVVYDGEDLSAVGALLDMPVEEIVARHTKATYEVTMLGFAPGFPYLTGLDPRLTVTRLETPRTRVPAGSVGLAAGQTCVYPSASPGGWRLIGHTDAVLFDPTRTEPALLAPGDRVRFEAVRPRVAL